MKSYKENFAVKWHEIDTNKILRPIAFMNMAQECANVHSAALNFGYDELIALDEVWVLSRIKIIYDQPPVWGDKVSMETWHKGQQGLFWIRDFLLQNDAGETIGRATSSWVIMNIKTRHIERCTIFEKSPDVIDMSLNINAIDKPCDKIIPLKNLELARVHDVKYSEIDFNMHVNNAKYIEWVIDSLEHSFVKENILKEIQVNFISEARLGDKVYIYMAQEIDSNNNTNIYFEGKKDDKIIFQALATYK